MDCIIHICSALKHPADYHGRNIPCFVTKRTVIHFHCAKRTQPQYFRKNVGDYDQQFFCNQAWTHATAWTQCGFVRSSGVTTRTCCCLNSTWLCSQFWCHDMNVLLFELNVALFAVLVSRHEHTLLLELNVGLFVVLESRHEHTLLLEHNVGLFVVLESRHEHTLLLEHNVSLFVVLESRHEHTLLLEHSVAFFVVLESRHEHTLLLEHSVAFFVVLEPRHEHATAWTQRGFVRSPGVTARTHATAWISWDVRLTCCSSTQPTRGTAHYSHSSSSCTG